MTTTYALALLALLAAPAPAQTRPPAPPQRAQPVLAFPERGLDDSAAYAGYQTRFFRDAARNAVQVYLNTRESRVVHLWADAENESLGLTARDARGRPAALAWNGPDAAVGQTGRARTLAYALAAPGPQVTLGGFLLGSMRVERDYQYFQEQRKPFGPAYVAPEFERLAAAIAALDPATQPRHLALLGAPTVAALRARLRPTVTTRQADSAWIARVAQPSLDGRDTLALEVEVDLRTVAAALAGDSIVLRARTGAPGTGAPGGGTVPFTLRVATTGRALAPLAREQIFTPAFLAFVAAAQDSAAARPPGDPAAQRARWLERQTRGVELLATAEKLFAGLPTYATYFGRDQLVTALMMRPIWRSEAQEAVLGSVLRKLAPDGQVSHEEALGGQADREASAEYAAVVDTARRAARRGDGAGAARLMARAEQVLRDHRRVRENYHMVDDELQLPVLAARWLADDAVPAERKRAFLRDTSDGGGTRLDRLLRALALVARMTAPYAARPEVANLIAFAPRDSGRWASGSWRDSGAGYANGRWAMDVNAVWAPHALEAAGRILAALGPLGFPADSLARASPHLAAGTPLGTYARDPAALARAAATWRASGRHFLVRLGSAAVRARITARLAAMPAAERAYWTPRLAPSGACCDALTFLAVALDAAGRPIGVANSDPATRLFLGEREGGGVADTGRVAADVLRDVRLFTRAYPGGLFVDGVGTVVSNDAYAPPRVWAAFVRDHYHGPRVVWGREVSLFLLGVADRVAAAEAAGAGDPARAAYARELRDAFRRVYGAAEASGFHSELWTYEFRGGRPAPARYNTGNDVQLWTTADLVVQYVRSKVGL